MGCSKNRVDSEHLMAKLSYAGIELLPEDWPLPTEEEVSADPARRIDAVIINTCGFIKDAKVESINVILEAVAAKARGLVGHIFVFGCLSQRYKDELVAEIPEVDAFFGAFDWDSLLKAVDVIDGKSLETSRYLTTPAHYAYLKISASTESTFSC